MQEILGLVWAKINFEYAGRGIITFHRTKNRRDRTEFLIPRTREALLEWREHQEWMRHRKKIHYNGSGLVFCRLNGNPVRRFDKAWKEACRKAGINGFHFHDLRHTFCSNLLLTGADLKDVKEMIGHSDISMKDRYSHLTLDRKPYRTAENTTVSYSHLTLDRKLFWQEQLAKHYSNENPTHILISVVR